MEMRKDNILFSFTSTNKQNNLSNDNKVSINFGKCEKILKDFYNISYNDSLYIYKVEVKLSDIKIPKIEYEVYYPLFNNILFQLNLSLCKEEKIDILIPFILNIILINIIPTVAIIMIFVQKQHHIKELISV